MQIKINKIEMLTGKDSGNPYWKLETNKGNMSAFDKEIADVLYDYWRKGVECYVDATPSKDGKYVNIRKILTPQEDADMQEINKQYDNFIKPDVQKPQDLGKVNPMAGYKVVNGVAMPEEAIVSPYNPASMYVSYAKDIFCKALESWKGQHMTDEQQIKCMRDSINLVKQAHKEFS